MLIPAPPLVISEETTRITGPLTADGQIDFFKAIEEKMYPPELATDDNGFRIFTRQFGHVGYTREWEDSEFYRLQKYQKLGLDPDVPPTLTFPEEPYAVFRKFYEEKGEETPESRDFGKPWTLEEYPMFAGWIKEIDIPMDAVAEAIRKPIFFPPFLQSPESVESGKPQSLFAILLPDIQHARTIARIFQARATYRIGQGNIDGAIDDKLTLHRLGRQIAYGGSLVQYFVGMAIESMAEVIPVGANPAYPLTEQQIRRILECLDALPPRAPFTDANEWERYTALGAVQYLAHDKSLSETLFMMHTACRISLHETHERQNISDIETLASQRLVIMMSFMASFDWNTVYRRVNEAYDTLWEQMQERLCTLGSERPLPKNFFSQMLTPSGRGTILADYLLDFWLTESGWENAVSAMQRRECIDNMQRLTWAILLYQCEHGKLPDENWTEQIEKYLGENVEQYFSCPSNPVPKGKTTYALVQYGDTGGAVPGSHDTILLVELLEAVPLDKAVITVDEVRERKRTGDSHPGGMCITHRSSAVRFLPSSVKKEELLRLLGHDVE